MGWIGFSLFGFMGLFLMVVNNFYVEGFFVFLLEIDMLLGINVNVILFLAIVF